MQRILVVYRSKYGATKKYAEWLSDALGCKIVESSKCNRSMLADYDTIVYGGGIYATGIAGFSLIKRNFEILKNKKVVVFAVGASPYGESAFAALRERNFPDQMRDVPCFYCRGAFDERTMTMGDRILIKMLKKAVGKKDPSKYEPWEKELMDAAGEPGDWTSKEYLAPILDRIGL